MKLKLEFDISSDADPKSKAEHAAATAAAFAAKVTAGAAPAVAALAAADDAPVAPEIEKAKADIIDARARAMNFASQAKTSVSEYEKYMEKLGELTAEASGRSLRIVCSSLVQHYESKMESSLKKAAEDDNNVSETMERFNNASDDMDARKEELDKMQKEVFDSHGKVMAALLEIQIFKALIVESELSPKESLLLGVQEWKRERDTSNHDAAVPRPNAKRIRVEAEGAGSSNPGAEGTVPPEGNSAGGGVVEYLKKEEN